LRRLSLTVACAAPRLQSATHNHGLGPDWVVNTDIRAGQHYAPSCGRGRETNLLHASRADIQRDTRSIAESGNPIASTWSCPFRRGASVAARVAALFIDSTYGSSTKADNAILQRLIRTTRWFELLIPGLGSPSAKDIVNLPWGAPSLQTIAVQQQNGREDTAGSFLHESAQAIKYVSGRIPFSYHLENPFLDGDL
jgi:hypothetical protein